MRRTRAGAIPRGRTCRLRRSGPRRSLERRDLREVAAGPGRAGRGEPDHEAVGGCEHLLDDLAPHVANPADALAARDVVAGPHRELDDAAALGEDRAPSVAVRRLDHDAVHRLVLVADDTQVPD